MIGRRLLTRMTRLGLSMYAAIWCMSFTVCAYDNPIADMAVGDRTALLTEAAGDAADAKLVPGDEDPSGGAVLVDESDVTGAEDPDDAEIYDAATEGMDDPDGEDIEGLEDEEVIEEVSEEDATSTLMSLPDSAMFFNVSNLTITNISKSYKVHLVGVGELEDVTTNQTTYEFGGLSSSDLQGINVSVDADDNFVFSFNDNWNGQTNKLFNFTATYDNAGSPIVANLDISVYVPVGSIIITAESEGSVIDEDYDIEVNPFDASKNLTLTISGDFDEQLEGSRVKWEILDLVRGRMINLDSDSENISMKDNPSNPGLSKILSFKDGFDAANLNISVRYNNSYIDAEGNEIQRGGPLSSCHLLARMPEPDVTSIWFSPNMRTVTNITGFTNFTIGGNGVINASRLSFMISPTNSTEDLTNKYNGINISTTADGVGIMQFDYSWRQANCDPIYVFALYNNTRGQMVTCSCKVAVYAPVYGIDFFFGNYRYGNEIDYGEIEAGECISLGMNATNHDPRVVMDPEQFYWLLYVKNGTRWIELFKDFTGKVEYYVDYSGTYANVTVPDDLTPGQYKLMPYYANRYIDVYGRTNSTSSVSGTCYFNIPSLYYYNVTSIELNPNDWYIGTGNYSESIRKVFAGDEFDPEEITDDDLDPDKLIWGLAEPGSDVIFNSSYIKVTDNNNTVGLEVFRSTDYYEFDLVARYYNDGDPSDSEAPYVEGRRRLVHGAAIPDIEAHLSENALKVQIYNGKNEVPLTIRSSKLEDNKYLHYSLRTVEIINEELDNYVDAFIEDDGKIINLRARSSVLALPAKELSALLKKKFSTGFIVSAVVDGNPETLTTVDNITISFGNVKPTAKNIKLNGTLELDSYYQGEIKELSFIGGNVKQLIPIDSFALSKLGFALIGGTRVQTLPTIPATKKGSFKAIAIIDDTENFNLPENYNITVTVNYVVKNSAPKLVTDVSSILLNTKTGDTRVVNYYIDGVVDYGTDVSYYIVDSKNKNCTEELSILGGDYDYDTGIGWFRLSANEKTRPGQTYKLCQCVVHDGNSRTGAVDIITVKTVAEASTGKMGLALKATGGLDASYPKQALNITCTGKNVNLYGRETYDVSVKLKNGTEVTELFLPLYDPSSGVMTIHQTPDENIGKFPMYETGLAGQAIDITIRIKVSDTEWVNATYSTKIGNSKVTPKLGLTKVSLNPDYIRPKIGSYVEETRIDIPITNLVGGYYSYNITLDYGNLDPAPFTYEFVEGDYDEPDVVQVIPDASAMSAMIGKTCTVKITPLIPEGNGMTATCKITVLNPTKNKAAVTAKANGSIDAVKDGTYATISFTFKNCYMDENNQTLYSWSKITKKNGKTETDCSGMFWNYTDNRAGTIRFRRRSGVDLEAGTYTAYVGVSMLNPEKQRVSLNTTVTFKVIRGKTGTTVKPSPVKMINRDYARTATVYIAPKYTGLNKISDVKILAPYADNMTITKTGDGVYELEFRDTYIEGSVVKKIWQAITKFVSRKVQLEVYYEGSTKPDKVTASVKINP